MIMPRASHAPRLVVGGVAEVTGWKDTPTGKWAGIVHALAGRYEVSDAVQVHLPQWRNRLDQARSVHPSKERWRSRASLSPAAFEARSRLLSDALAERADDYDLLVLLQTMCAPTERAPGKPYVIYTDNTFPLMRRGWPAGAASSRSAARRWQERERRTAQGAGAVFTMSGFVRESFITDYGVDPDRVHAVGAGANRMLPSLEEPWDGPPTALFVGFDFERKGGRAVVEAWRRVVRDMPEARLRVIGRGRPSEDDPPGISFEAPVPGGALADLYRQATLFVLPSIFEPFGFAFLEAMGHGLPVVAADTCAMPEIVEDGVTGSLVPPGDPEPLAAALLDLLRDRDKARAMGRRGYHRVRERWQWSHVADRMAPVLDAAV